MKRTILPVLIILLITGFFFKSYITGGKLLFPTNMLVAFYPPWNTIQFPGWRLIPFKGLGHDNVLFFYPEKMLLRQGVQEQSIPLWNPYNFAGGQLFGDGQAAPMYPLTLLYLVLPLPEAFSVMVILVPTLTMLFTYGLLRHLKTSRLGSLFGAVAFAFSGFMAGWMEENPAVAQSAIWLPALVWMTDLLITKPNRLWFILTALLTAITMSAGFLQISLYAIFFTIAYAVFRANHTWKRLIPFGLALVSGLLLVGPYLTTTWEAYKLSPRDFVPIEEIRTIFLVRWSHILSLFNPDWLGNPGSYNYLDAGSYYDKTFFVGVVPFLFILYAFFSKKATLEKFFWWTTAATIALGFSSPFSQWLFNQPIPILTSMLPSRIFYLTSFALAIVAARMFDRTRISSWYNKFSQHTRPVLLTYLVLLILLEVFLVSVQLQIEIPKFPAGLVARKVQLFIASGIQIIPKVPTVVVRNVTISIFLTFISFVLLYAARRVVRLRIAVPIALFVLTVLSQWYFTNKALYDGERQFLYPPHPMLTKLNEISGIWRVGYADDLSRVPPNANVVYGFYSFEGLNPVFPYRYGQLVRAAVKGGTLTNDIPRISVKMDLKEAVVNPPTAARMKRLLGILGVRYVVERKESGWYAPTYPTHTKLWEDPYYRIWENPDILPRAFIATQTIQEHESQKILDMFFDPTVNLRVTAIVEGPVHLKETSAKNSTEILSYRMNDITLKTHADTNGLLVVTDTWAPGWRAMVDGVNTPVYRTDFNFRGVPVPAGDHTVVLSYFPASFILGLWVMAGGVILLIVGVIAVKQGKDRASLP